MDNTKALFPSFEEAYNSRFEDVGRATKTERVLFEINKVQTPSLLKMIGYGWAIKSGRYDLEGIATATLTNMERVWSCAKNLLTSEKQSEESMVLARLASVFVRQWFVGISAFRFGFILRSFFVWIEAVCFSLLIASVSLGFKLSITVHNTLFLVCLLSAVYFVLSRVFYDENNVSRLVCFDSSEVCSKLRKISSVIGEGVANGKNN